MNRSRARIFLCALTLRITLVVGFIHSRMFGKDSLKGDIQKGPRRIQDAIA